MDRPRPDAILAWAPMGPNAARRQRVVSGLMASNDKTDSGDAPLIDLNEASIKKLIARAKRRGVITYDELNEALPQDQMSSEQIEDIMAAISEMGVNIVESDEDGHTIYCAFADLGEVSKALEGALGEATSVKAIWKPQTNVPVDEERAQSLMKLVATLEDDDDVQNVYANFEVDDATLAKLSAA